MVNEFQVIDISMSASNISVRLEIKLRRLNFPFWRSVFIPSMCLILASEMTLFIDRKHFEATIMVDLTANLVMYTMYYNVQYKLPDDPSFKLIDAWLLHGLIMPMVVFFILVLNELKNSDTSQEKQHVKTNDTKKAKSHIKGQAWTQAWLTNQHKNCTTKNGSTFIMVSQIVVPAISVLFTITFFALGLFGGY